MESGARARGPAADDERGEQQNRIFTMVASNWTLGLALSLSLLLFTTVYGGSDDGGTDDDGDQLEATNIILFLFFGLGLGVVVTQVLSIWGESIPYTVVIFLLGLLFSLADSSRGKNRLFFFCLRTFYFLRRLCF